MPELPEVETVVRDLDPLLTGQDITDIWVSKKRLRRPWPVKQGRRLIGRWIYLVWRRGKWIVIQMDEGPRLLIHLGMSGQLTVVPAGEPRAPHTHLVIRLEKGAKELRLCDPRRFGSATVATGKEMAALFEQLGPEPFEVPLGYWKQCLAGSRRCLKALLLDQRVVAGVGNIYADESLFEAGLHPARLGCDLSADEAARLRKAVAKVLRRAIRRRGSSIRNYVGGSGLKGEYQNEFRVYGRTGEPCPRCRSRIACIRLAGRSTHYCPRCQRRKDEG